MLADHGQQAIDEMRQATSIADLCAQWPSKYRGILVACQGVLRIFYPHGSDALAVIISLLDGFCSGPLPAPVPPIPAPTLPQETSSIGPFRVGEVG